MIHSETNIHIRYPSDFLDLVLRLECSLLISTYRTGQIIIISAANSRLKCDTYDFPRPMGVAVDGQNLAIATQTEIIVFSAEDSAEAGSALGSEFSETDFVVRRRLPSVNMDFHDMVWSDDRLWAVNTRYSCLCTVGPDSDVIPRWRPSFITDLVPEDRCHLNGMTMRNGSPHFVTALGESNDCGGWRPTKANGGIVVHVPSNEIVVSGMSMPHSPREYDGMLYVLNSGTGELMVVDPEGGRTTTLLKMPGFVRGMSRLDDYLFIGLSRIRSRRTLGNLPLDDCEKDLVCGVAAVHLPSAAMIGLIEFHDGCDELYDVHALPGIFNPRLVGSHDTGMRI